MRISDWSSDVCSSDLLAEDVARAARDAGEILISNREVGHELGLGEGFGLARIELASRDKRHLVDKARPLPRQRGVGFATGRSEEHTSELQSLMRISYAVFCLKKKKRTNS